MDKNTHNGPVLTIDELVALVGKQAIQLESINLKQKRIEAEYGNLATEFNNKSEFCMRLEEELKISNEFRDGILKENVEIKKENETLKEMLTQKQNEISKLTEMNDMLPSPPKPRVFKKENYKIESEEV